MPFAPHQARCLLADQFAECSASILFLEVTEIERLGIASSKNGVAQHPDGELLLPTE